MTGEHECNFNLLLCRLPKPDPAWVQRGFNCVLRILKSEIDPSLERWILSQEKEFIELYPPSGSANKTFLAGKEHGCFAIILLELQNYGCIEQKIRYVGGENN